MSTEAISPLRQRMIEDMNSRQLGAHTQRSHIYSCKRFAAFLERSPDTATLEDIRLFQLHLAETGMSICNRNRIMTGVRFLLRVTLRRLDLSAEIYHLREPQKIPQVMSPDETRRLLAVATSLKARVLLSLSYGCGLRAGEVVRLKVKHIDSAQRIIRIEQSKGRKDRHVMLSPETVDLLRQWWKVRRGFDDTTPLQERWLFPGRRLGKPMTTRQLSRLFHEASLCSNEHVILVGAGNSSAQASLHLARYAAKVTIVMRGDSLKANVSEYLVHRIQTTPNIEVLPNTVVAALHGDDRLHAVTLRNLKTGEERIVETTSLFLCLGGVPNTQWAAEVGIVRDEEGYLVTGPDLGRGGTLPENWTLNREPYYLETNMPGVFAAGDVRHSSIKRIASAVGEGAMVVAFVHRYLAAG